MAIVSEQTRKEIFKQKVEKSIQLRRMYANSREKEEAGKQILEFMKETKDKTSSYRKHEFFQFLFVFLKEAADREDQELFSSLLKLTESPSNFFVESKELKEIGRESYIPKDLSIWVVTSNPQFIALIEVRENEVEFNGDMQDKLDMPKICYAICTGNIELAQYYLSKGEIIGYPHIYNPLKAAILSDKIEMVQWVKKNITMTISCDINLMQAVVNATGRMTEVVISLFPQILEHMELMSILRGYNKELLNALVNYRGHYAVAKQMEKAYKNIMVEDSATRINVCKDIKKFFNFYSYILDWLKDDESSKALRDIVLQKMFIDILLGEIISSDKPSKEKEKMFSILNNEIQDGTNDFTDALLICFEYYAKSARLFEIFSNKKMKSFKAGFSPYALDDSNKEGILRVVTSKWIGNFIVWFRPIEKQPKLDCFTKKIIDFADKKLILLAFKTGYINEVNINRVYEYASENNKNLNDEILTMILEWGAHYD